MNHFNKTLNKNILIFDGGMGTLLQECGLLGGELPELWNIKKPNEILNIHKSYVDAGCDIIKTNTFGANSLKLNDTGYSISDVISAGVNLARQACAANTAVALDIGPSGKLLKPFGDLSFDDAYTLFSEMIIAGKDADLILIETMSDTYEVKAAILAAKENSDLPIIVTYTFDEKGKLLTGGSIAAAVCLAESLGVSAIGINCGLGPAQVLELMPQLTELTELPICINPNAGLPVTVNGKTMFNVDAKEFSDFAVKLVESGAAIVGGCCGTTPSHIKALYEKLHGKPTAPRTITKRTVVSSYSKTVTFDKRPILIGERINPTGKPRLKQALRENDFEFVCREGLDQTECGADILDVNVGLPEIDESAAMEKAITMLQGVTDTPLQIDTSDINAMERALRVYNGKPLVNSVNGKSESLHTILPLVKKYGAAVVALTLDESGIPASAKERIKIAEKIIKTAEEYGISRNDIIIDTLAMTVSTGSENAITTLDALGYIKTELKVNTILGVSNISFGLPRREILTGTFFAMAMQRGLSSGIINPMSEEIMKAYHSYCALMGIDNGCKEYIDAYANTQPESLIVTGQTSLHHAIIKGLKEQASDLTLEMLKTEQPLDIINNHLIPALDKVGKGFELGTLFLPQLLMSADAAKEAFERIKVHLAGQGIVTEKKGKIILATVKGDIHDIGKNIVKVLLENYGFDVIDLGKDVPPELVVQTAIEQAVQLVGLSALMTTTVSNMEVTIKMLREVHDCKIMVGGAVLNEEYATMIGADFYSKDAMGSVRYADKLFA